MKKLPFCKLEFILTYKCNYNCDYCYQKEDRKNSFVINLNEFKNYLKYFLLKFDKLEIILMGGEITYFEQEKHFSFFEFLLASKSFKNKIEKINLTTNFSNPDFIINLKKLNLENLEINITKHINKKLNVEKLKLLTDLNVIINYFENDLDIKYINDLKKEFKNIKFIKRKIDNEIYRTKKLKKCLPFFYKIDKRGIFDFCRDKIYKNLLEFKIENKIIKCDYNCSFCNCKKFVKD